MVRLASVRDKKHIRGGAHETVRQPIDVRTPSEFLADLRKAGVDAIPIVTATNHLLIRRSDGSVNFDHQIRWTGSCPPGHRVRQSHVAL